MPRLKRTLDPRYCIYYGKYQPLGTMNDNPRMWLNIHRIGNPLVDLTNPPI